MPGKNSTIFLANHRRTRSNASGRHERIQIGGRVCASDGVTEEPVAAIMEMLI